MANSVIRLQPAGQWYFLHKDIMEKFARVNEAMDRALWDAEDDLRRTDNQKVGK